MKTFEEVYSVVKFLDDLYEGCNDAIMFIARGGEVRVFLNMNDMFYWATADVEEFSPEDIPIYQKVIKDIETLRPGEHDYLDFGDLLFACRKRNMKPQKPVLTRKPQWFQDLCNKEFPERDE